MDVDECTTLNPCRNGATCRNTNGSYVCVCLNGYEGKNCDINPDDCFSGSNDVAFFLINESNKLAIATVIVMLS